MTASTCECGAEWDPPDDFPSGETRECPECGARYQLVGYVVERVTSQVWRPADEPKELPTGRN